jgi:hypothetical protein
MWQSTYASCHKPLDQASFSEMGVGRLELPLDRQNALQSITQTLTR